MGNYRQHLTFASSLGVFFAWGSYVLAGVHWLYGTVAALLTTLGGLLPDLDHPTGTELKGFTGILGVLAATAVWEDLEAIDPSMSFELHLLAVVGAYVVVRHGLRRVLVRLMVHRGISHSLPACAVWGALTYLYYPTDSHGVRSFMAAAVMIGFLSHLLLDEMFSVDLRGVRIKRSFGTALKCWSSSPWATLAIYALLSFLSWRVLQIWPDRPAEVVPLPATHLPVPSLPDPLPQGLR